MFQFFVVINDTGHLISISTLRGKCSQSVPPVSSGRKGKTFHETEFSKVPHMLVAMKLCGPAMLIISSNKYFVA